MKTKGLLYVVMMLCLVAPAFAGTQVLNKFATSCQGIDFSVLATPNSGCTLSHILTADNIKHSGGNSRNALFGTAGGVYMEAKNTQINDCLQIKKVELCYKRNAPNTDSCTTKVDLNGDGSYSIVGSGCTGFNDVYNCLDVSNAENYTCSNINSGNGFRAYSYGYETNVGWTGTVQHDVFVFKVTYDDTNTQSPLTQLLLTVLVTLYIVGVLVFLVYRLQSGADIQETIVSFVIMLVLIPLLTYIILPLLG